MAINIGMVTFDNPSPNSTSWSTTLIPGKTSHTQLAGADGFIYFEFAISGTWTLNSATWDGVGLTLLDVNYIPSINIRHYRYYLSSPAVGTKILTLNFSSNYTTSFTWNAQSFTNCGGIIDNDWTGLAPSPHTDTMTVAANDRVYVSGISQWAIPHINIDGIDYYNPGFTAHSNVEADQYAGQVTGNLSVGSIDATMDAGDPFFQITNSWVKFTEAGVAPPSGSTEGSWWLLMRLV